MTILNRNDFARAKMHVVVTPGEALKMIRELQDMSQNELSEETGISQSNISALENNAITFGRERAITLAKALHVHPSVLMFPDFDMEQVA